MKQTTKLLLTVAAALGLPVYTHADTVLSQAQITKIVKDVKTIDPGKGARNAVMKETLQGKQAVRTGIDSRTELLFNDNTITRLGANTHFSFTEGTRNMSLDSGVMLLQVPKGIGGAKIETAAVTAAVTGTTIMVEAGKDYTKLIVLEGECCLWPRAKKEQENSKLYKMRKKVCAEAGQEIILRNGSKEVPPPVYVNLRILEDTSRLVTGSWGTDLNHEPINAAKNDQGPGDYIPTNLAIIGAGTDVVVIQQQNPPGSPDNPPTPPETPPVTPTPTVIPPSKYGPLQVISGNPYVIGAGSAINTDPTITSGGQTSYGRIYRGSILDGPPADYLFGPASGVSNSDFDYAFVDQSGNLFPNYGVAAFKFTNLLVNGMPTIAYSENGPGDIAFISQGDINIATSTPTTLDFQGNVHNLLFATTGGNIDINANTTLQGITGNLSLYNTGAGHNITLDGVVHVGNTFNASTQGTFGGAGYIDAPYVNIVSGGTLNLNEIQDVELGNTDDINGVQLNMNSLWNLSLTGNAINITNGFYGEPQFSEGPTVDLNLYAHEVSDNPGDGDISLSGAITLDNFYASADHDITVNSSANIYSSNSVSFYASNDINADGIMNAYDITLSGYDVNTFNTNSNGVFEATNVLEIDSANDTTIGNSIIGGTVNITAGNNITISGTGSIGGGTINLTANNTIEIDGYIGGMDGPAGSFTADTTGGGGALADGVQDFFSSGTTQGQIDAQTITIKSRGDLNLGTDINSQLVLNQVLINPNTNLQELDLTGSTIEIGTVNPGTSPFTLNATSSGNLTITGDITVDTFSINVGGMLLSGTSHTVTAGTVSITVGNDILDLENTTANTFTVTDNSAGSPSFLNVVTTGSNFSLSVSANSLTVGNIGSQGSGYTLNLTSANDINGGETPTQGAIYSASSVALKVGVDATLAGDYCGGIYYNNSELLANNVELPAQLYIDTSSLGSFSLEASSVTVNGGFPNIPGTLTLTADTGDITINTYLTANSDITMTAAGKIDIEADLYSTQGGIFLTANGGDIILNGTGGGNLGTNNDVTLQASGNINIGHDFASGGSANLNAGGDIVINDTNVTPIVNIGGGLTLTSGSSITINNQVSINGSLNLSAQTDIHSTNSLGAIVGATDVTLSLGVASNISIASGTLIFAPTTETSPVLIDMATVTQITATATSLTLTSDFNQDMDLALIASNGDLNVNGAVTAFALTANATNGNVTISQPVNVTFFNADAENGSAIFNAPITATADFSAFASKTISGTGLVSAPSVELTQGGTSTVTQSGNILKFGTLPVNLDTTTGGATSISLQAGPLQLGTDLSLSTADLSLSGKVNAQSHTISASSIGLTNVQTVTDSSGNGTNLTLIGANGVSFYGNESDIVIHSFQSNSNTSVNLSGAAGTQGSGGTLTASTTMPTDGEGRGDINVNGDILANGADANPTGGKAGGNGGTVNLTSAAGIYLYGNVSATSGINSNTSFPGGNGGTVNLTAQGEIYVNSKVEVSSSDLVHNRVSAKGGTVNITSHATSGIAINIANSGQIASLLNQAAPGPGGVITFVADSGGDINVNGSVRADHGTVAILNTGTGSGNVSLNGASLAGDVVKVQTVSPNGTITVNGGIMNADTAIKLYAVGSNGMVDFTGNTSLMGSSLKSIAGNTVQIENGVTVNVAGGQATIYTNNANYNASSGGNNSRTGVLTGNYNSVPQPLANRPSF